MHRIKVSYAEGFFFMKVWAEDTIKALSTARSAHPHAEEITFIPKGDPSWVN